MVTQGFSKIHKKGLSLTFLGLMVSGIIVFAGPEAKETTSQPDSPKSSSAHPLKKDLLSKEEPILINSDKASYNNKTGVAIYQGNVKASKGVSVMEADKIEGVNDKDGKGFESMVSTGEVVFKAEDKQGCAEVVYYYNGSEQTVISESDDWDHLTVSDRLALLEKSNKNPLPLQSDQFERLIMEINPKISQGSSLIMGERMRFFKLLEILEVNGDVFVHYRSTPKTAQESKKNSDNSNYLAQKKREISEEKPVENPLSSDAEPKEEQSIFIFCDNAVLYQSLHQIFFYGKIKIYRAGMIILADQMTAYLDDSMKELEKIIADRGVKVLWEKRDLTAGKGVFLEKEQKMVFTDKPVAIQGKSKMTGERMVYDMVKDTVTVKKAHSYIHPKDFQRNKTKN